MTGCMKITRYGCEKEKVSTVQAVGMMITP